MSKTKKMKHTENKTVWKTEDLDRLKIQATEDFSRYLQELMSINKTKTTGNSNR